MPLMRAALRILLLAAGASAGATTAGTCQGTGSETAQKPPVTSADAKPAVAEARNPRQQKAIARLRQDLTKIEANLNHAPHAYRGTVTFECRGDAADLHSLELDFTGASNRTLQWFFLDDWQVVHRGEHTAVTQGETPWGKPQGDSPDVPLSPRLFLPHLAKAELSLPMPAEHNGRPALRIHARWRGKPATRALYATTVPSSKHEQILEALGRAAAKDTKKLFMVDATMLYDPAARQWLSSTLRFSYLDGRDIPADVMSPPSPAGLPALQSFPVIETIWHLERCDPKHVMLPKLDKNACELLRVDATGKSTAAPATKGEAAADKLGRKRGRSESRRQARYFIRNSGASAELFTKCAAMAQLGTPASRRRSDSF